MGECKGCKRENSADIKDHLTYCQYCRRNDNQEFHRDLFEFANNCNLTTCRHNENGLKDKLLTKIMEKHYKEFGLNEENRYIFRDVVEKYGDMTYRHLCENYCFRIDGE